MKKIFFCIIYALAFSSVIGQDYTSLNNKYWFYRTRLRNDFMKVGLEQGCSIPMEQRGLGYEPNHAIPFTMSSNSGADAQWGDAMGELGYYIGILATEYYLLKLNNQETDSVKYELYCALSALNRMDYWAEAAFNQATGQSHAQSLNGFMVRDDVPIDFIQNNMKSFNYFGNRGFCSKIKLNKVISSSGNDAITAGKKLPPHEDQYRYSGAYISQDNWINCMVGLALVRKFVPPNETYNGLNFMDGQSASLSQESFAIALRVHNYLKSDPSWLLRYPSGSLIGSNWGGIATGLAFAHGESLNKMDQFKWGHYSFPDWISFNSICQFFNWANSGGNLAQFYKWNFLIPIQMGIYPLLPHISGNLHNPFSMAPGIVINPLQGPTPGGELTYKIGSLYITTPKPDVSVQATNISALCDCSYSYIGNTTALYLPAHINRHQIWHPELLRVALHGEGDCNTNSLNLSYYNAAISLISDAPCEGPYNWVAFDSGTGTFINYGPDSPYHWHTQSQLDHPEGRDGNGMIGEFNGIDYMFYHNLINIIDIQKNGITDAKKMVDFGRRHITINYPTSISGTTWGTISKPAIVKSYEYITANNTVGISNLSQTDVSYLAGKEIALVNGFSATNQGNFTAAIQQFECHEIMSNPLNPSVNARTANSSNNSQPTIYPDLIATSYTKSNVVEEQPNIVYENEHHPALVNVDTLITKKYNVLFGNLNADVSPNPSTGLSKLYITKPDLVSSIDVLDPIANLLMTFNTVSYSNDIDLSNYGKGIYSFVIKGNNGDVIVKKVIIQ